MIHNRQPTWSATLSSAKPHPLITPWRQWQRQRQWHAMTKTKTMTPMYTFLLHKNIMIHNRQPTWSATVSNGFQTCGSWVNLDSSSSPGHQLLVSTLCILCTLRRFHRYKMLSKSLNESAWPPAVGNHFLHLVRISQFPQPTITIINWGSLNSSQGLKLLDFDLPVDQNHNHFNAGMVIYNYFVA